VFVMADRETGTTWSHYTGEALDGPLKGRRLAFVKVDRGTLAELAEGHEGAQVLERSQLRWRDKPLPTAKRSSKGDLGRRFAQSLEGSAPRGELPAHTHGLGVAVGEGRRFYSLEQLYDGGVISDTLGGVPVVVMVHDGSSTAAAYSRCLDGDTLTLSPVQHEGESALRADDGTVFDAKGRGVAGPRQGAQLISVWALITDWYGWAAFYPDTSIYGR
jgi:hypothetical protein